MTDNFETLLNNAIERLEGLDNEAFIKPFQLIYPFTTENISGYINEFDLREKTLMTVGSSGDQVINAILNGCSDITILDVNPYTKFYFYLKEACILDLELEFFLKFLRFKDFPKVFKNNKEIFNKNTYNKIKNTLRALDYESYLFWDELFQTFKPVDIRKELFYFDESRTNVILGCNPYLESENSYNEVKEKIKKAQLTFITNDLFKTTLDKEFDNVWLSNIGTYLSRHFVKIMTDRMDEYLKPNGKLLISYLYKTTIDTKYQDDWCLIYDLEKTFDILKEYNPYLVSFIGTDGLKFQDDNIKDSVLIYHKTKKV